nr:MAG TPA: Restriction endonuclease [Caudoviricetes sp.]
MSRRPSKSDVGCLYYVIKLGIILFILNAVATSVYDYWGYLLLAIAVIGGIIIIVWQANKLRKDREEYKSCFALSQVNIDWHDIDYMEGHMFEHYIAQLLRKNGFQHVEVTVASGDYGTDIIAHKNGLKYAIQCKRYSPGSRIGLKPVQEIYSGRIHYNADAAVVITNLYFSENAKVLAKETGVVLWDRDKLEELIYNASFK